MMFVDLMQLGDTPWGGPHVVGQEQTPKAASI